MNDDERDSDPFPSKDPPQGEQPMNYVAAAAWSFGMTLAMFFLIQIVIAIRPAAQSDFVTLFACQIIATLLVLFLILRLHAPDKSIRDFLGIRSTHLGFYPLAALLGVVVQVPATALFDLITRRYPVAEHDDVLYEALVRGWSLRLVVIVVFALAGPLVEEVFFRGALFRPLRKRYDATGVIFATSLFFGAAHLEWQRILPIALLGLVLGTLRHMSGSLLPSFVMHGVFNGVSLYALYTHAPSAETNTPIPRGIAIGGSVATLALLGLVHLLGRKSASAAEARRKDEA